jgi:CRISPR-associated protein Cas2
MYIILVYDVNEKRVGKVCKYLKRYLPRVQNSVFEGNLSESKLANMKKGLGKFIDTDADCVLLWVMRDSSWTDRQILGNEKLPVSNFL